MTLPAPALDDRSFQDIVDEAKRLIPRYCPEWTDHNVSDPGVTLIELFAWMTEMMLYRVNQIPDKHYTKFLELMGIELFPASPARTELAFWLSAPQPEAVRVHAGTKAGTQRTEQEESVVFMTDSDLVIVVPKLTSCLTATSEGNYEDHWDDLRVPGQTVTCFRTVTPGDAIYFGFEESLAGNIVRLDFQASSTGKGVQPDNPPWAWEAWSGDHWEPVRVYRDETAGLNTNGAVVLVVPREHQALIVGPKRAFWLRCRIDEPGPDRPGYTASPEVAAAAATSLGGTMIAHHGDEAPREILGTSEGVPGQWFEVRRTPALPRRRGETVVVTADGSAEEWREVGDFSASSSSDLHFTWDASSGVIAFGPEVRHPDGSKRQHGAIPKLGAEIAVTGYRFGGGVRGNVGAGTVSVLKSSIPFVGRVENLGPGEGGVDAETVENAKRRGPLSLRTGERAVTVQDFERLTLEASPGVARARCLPPLDPVSPVRVLIVPRVEIRPERLTLDDLALPEEVRREVSDYLEDRRILTTTVELSTPFYQGVTVTARVKRAADADPALLRDRLLTKVYRYIEPIAGGPEGGGWPFGRDLNIGEVFGLLANVEGVASVEEVTLYLADLATGDRREVQQRARLRDDSVFVSYKHQVLVT
jgi:predicted phage baseplate assembly protein